MINHRLIVGVVVGLANFGLDVKSHNRSVNAAPLALWEQMFPSTKGRPLRKRDLLQGLLTRLNNTNNDVHHHDELCLQRIPQRHYVMVLPPASLKGIRQRKF